MKTSKISAVAISTIAFVSPIFLNTFKSDAVSLSEYESSAIYMNADNLSNKIFSDVDSKISNEKESSSDKSSTEQKNTDIKTSEVNKDKETKKEIFPQAIGDISWIISKESGGNPYAENGLYKGIGQLSENYYQKYLGLSWSEVSGNYELQLKAMRMYISERYGTVENAIQHWISNNWY